MTWWKLLALVLFALALACGQILFKMAAQSIKGPMDFDLSSLVRLALNPYLLLAVTIYALSTVWWVWLLRSVDLSRGYLVVALALVLVPLAGTFFFREPFTARLVVGMIIILVGLAVALW